LLVCELKLEYEADITNAPLPTTAMPAAASVDSRLNRRRVLCTTSSSIPHEAVTGRG
jgi:hypothetical protein